ncbi:hypothetical protein MP228_010949 [Amoeboaphelidium protococcarum]|nr:hypothetical protein MP228_010949 [Amoeboaphelidium protococcarum]
MNGQSRPKQQKLIPPRQIKPQRHFAGIAPQHNAIANKKPSLVEQQKAGVDEERHEEHIAGDNSLERTADETPEERSKRLRELAMQKILNTGSMNTQPPQQQPDKQITSHTIINGAQTHQKLRYSLHQNIVVGGADQRSLDPVASRDSNVDLNIGFVSKEERLTGSQKSNTENEQRMLSLQQEQQREETRRLLISKVVQQETVEDDLQFGGTDDTDYFDGDDDYALQEYEQWKQRELRRIESGI